MSIVEHKDFRSEAKEARTMLRVLDGRLAGAQHRLAPDTTVRVGHGLANDIVLRGRETVGVMAELMVRADDIKVSVVNGSARLLGSRLDEGSSALLPAYVPLKIGEYNVAVGGDDEERWQEAADIAARSSGEMTEAESTDILTRPKLGDQTRSHWSFFTSYLPDWMKGPGFLLIAAFAVVLTLAVEPLRQIVDSEINGLDDAQTAVAAAGYTGVKVSTDPAIGNMLVSGIVRDEKELTQLREMVERRFSGAVFDVETTQSLARAANDFLAGQNVDATASANGIGKIKVTSEYLPGDRQEELKTLLRKDLPKLAGISFMLTGARGPDDLKYFFNSEKYGLAAYIDGAPGHIVTADGSFWFEGSTLPTGHKLVHARDGSLTFERNGQIEEIRMAPKIPQLASEDSSEILPGNAPDAGNETKILAAENVKPKKGTTNE